MERAGAKFGLGVAEGKVNHRVAYGSLVIFSLLVLLGSTRQREITDPHSLSLCDTGTAWDWQARPTMARYKLVIGRLEGKFQGPPIGGKVIRLPRMTIRRWIIVVILVATALTLWTMEQRRTASGAGRLSPAIGAANVLLRGRTSAPILREN